MPHVDNLPLLYSLLSQVHICNIHAVTTSGLSSSQASCPGSRQGKARQEPHSNHTSIHLYPPTGFIMLFHILIRLVAALSEAAVRFNHVLPEDGTSTIPSRPRMHQQDPIIQHKHSANRELYSGTKHQVDQPYKRSRQNPRAVTNTQRYHVLFKQRPGRKHSNRALGIRICRYIYVYKSQPIIPFEANRDEEAQTCLICSNPLTHPLTPPSHSPALSSFTSTYLPTQLMATPGGISVAK